MASYTVIVTEPVFDDLEVEQKILGKIDAQIRVEPVDTPAELIERGTDADGIIVIDTPVTREVFENLPELSVVGKCGIGVDNIDVSDAADFGVQIVNAPEYCIEEVSTHALSLMLATVRKIPLYDRQVRRGEWNWKSGAQIRRLAGSSFGFVGFGKIPQRLAEKLEGFGFEMQAFDPHQSDETLRDYGVEPKGFDELLRTSAIVSIHAPLTDETKEMFDKTAFQRMRDDAVIVNTARGDIIAQDALFDALKSNTIAGAGLDVLTKEPPDDSRLINLDSVVITPHVGWYSKAAKQELRETTARAVAQALRGERPDTLLN